MTAELLERSLLDLAREFAAGRSSPVSLIGEALERHARFGETLGAYRELDADLARAQASAAEAALGCGARPGPLVGIPVSVKDLYGVRGFGTYAGSPTRLPPRWEEEGPLVRTVRRQLAVVMGKTHTVEFAFGGLGTNPHHPTPRNPWDASSHRVPGGSSAGAGVTLAEGSALVALGTDTAGSVRIPASFTGQVGLKTTAGRWSTDGVVPLSRTLDTTGILTRTVEDAIYAFGALDPAWGDPATLEAALEALEPADLKLGLVEALFWDECSPGVAEGVRSALAELESKGCRLRTIDMPEVEPAHAMFRGANPVSIELHDFLTEELPQSLETLDPNVAARVGDAADVPAAEYLRRLRRLKDLARAADERLRGLDAVVTPTVAVTPPTLEQVSDSSGYRRHNLLALRNTAMGSYLGLCAVTVPVALDAAGMPVGLQLMMRAGTEERLLAVARCIEQTLGTGPKRLGYPPLLIR